MLRGCPQGWCCSGGGNVASRNAVHPQERTSKQTERCNMPKSSPRARTCLGAQHRGLIIKILQTECAMHFGSQNPSPCAFEKVASLSARTLLAHTCLTILHNTSTESLQKKIKLPISSQGVAVLQKLPRLRVAAPTRQRSLERGLLGHTPAARPARPGGFGFSSQTSLSSFD